MSHADEVLNPADEFGLVGRFAGSGILAATNISSAAGSSKGEPAWSMAAFSAPTREAK